MLNSVVKTQKRRLGVWIVAAGCIASSLGHTPATAETGAPTFTVDGHLALTALMSLSDGHLAKMAHSLQILATSDAARSGNWNRIKGPLGEAANVNVAALNWFALPDGTYWSVQNGSESGALTTRPYFHRALAGQVVLADLVVSKATGKSVAIIAVPVVRPNRTVVGVLGASVYLDKLSARLKDEVGLAEPLLFYAFDATPLVALHWDPALIFIDPLQLGDEVSTAFKEMLSREQGGVSYRFRGTRRTLLYQKSPVTGWWYALGLARPE